MDTLSVIDKPITNISYLCARDPSILTWGCNLGAVKTNLQHELLEQTECSTLRAEFSSETDHLQVYLRIKKAGNFDALYEIVDGKSLLCKVPEGAHCSRNIRQGTALTKSFTFSKIFGADSTQLEMFNNVVKAKVLSFINGLNCSLLTYGASGSGKTFTIIGTADHPGIVPRALEYLFRTLPGLPEHPRFKPTVGGGIKKLTPLDCKLARHACLNLINVLTPTSEREQHARTYRAMQERLSEEPVATIMDDISHVNLSIWVSFAEIYNEYVYDLLKVDSVRGLQRQKLRVGYSNATAYIKDLTCINVSSGLEAYHILQYGLQNLNFAATTLNDHSSRSHSIFTIKLAQTSDTKEGISVSCFNFCDLAGSERIKKTHHVGERLKESNNINTSLLVLGRCISLVRDSQKRNEKIRIPFRESKLTQLFQNALQGLESISMIVSINPIRDMFDESQHVLNFSAIAKDVILEKQQVIVRSPGKKLSDTFKSSEFNSAERQKLLDQIELLYDEIEQQKLEHEDDQQSIIASYKKIIENTNQHWECRCKQLQAMLAKRIQDSDDYVENQPKKRKISIINLDSSDEEDNTIAKDDNNSTEKLNELKYELEAKEKALNTFKDRCQVLESMLQDRDSENFKLKEQIVELNEYIEAIGQPKSDYTDDKENVDSNTNIEYSHASTDF